VTFLHVEKRAKIAQYQFGNPVLAEPIIELLFAEETRYCCCRRRRRRRQRGSVVCKKPFVTKAAKKIAAAADVISIRNRLNPLSTN
jgi:hypothetical protein